MEFESILWLKNSVKVNISPRVIKDLNLEGVYHRLLNNNDILYSLIKDVETISFRQDILGDFMNNQKLLADLMKCLDAFKDLKPQFHVDKTKASSLYRIIDILIIIEKSVKVIDELGQTLNYYKIKSQGLLNLKANILNIQAAAEFKKMNIDLKEIKHLFKSIRSATLSVNMSPGMRPIFAQITSLDNHVFHYPKAFRHVSDVLKTNPMFLGQLLSSYAPVFKVNRLNYDLMEEIEYALRDHKDLLMSFIQSYDHVDIEPFIRLLDEIQFYQSSMALYDHISQRDLPLSKPNFIKSKFYQATIDDFYNINLAMVYSDEDYHDKIIGNDIVINQERRGFIITGANRGGKTTFTQAIGQVQLFAQLGLWVPARQASLVISNGIMTHFPVGEKENYETGKFGKECQRFVKAYHEGDANTLYLLNESFSGTSHLESLNIAAQGCMALLHKKSPFIFNTHLHELYDEVCREKPCHKEDLVSLVTKMKGSHSEYKLVEEKAYGKSYARSIAYKYGVTADQLMERR